MSTKFFICGGSDTHWIATGATILSGAKQVASKTYQAAVNGKIEIGEQIGSGDAARIETVAIKYGFDAWTQNV